MGRLMCVFLIFILTAIQLGSSFFWKSPTTARPNILRIKRTTKASSINVFRTTTTESNSVSKISTEPNLLTSTIDASTEADSNGLEAPLNASIKSLNEIQEWFKQWKANVSSKAMRLKDDGLTKSGHWVSNDSRKAYELFEKEVPKTFESLKAAVTLLDSQVEELTKNESNSKRENFMKMFNHFKDVFESTEKVLSCLGSENSQPCQPQCRSEVDLIEKKYREEKKNYTDLKAHIGSIWGQEDSTILNSSNSVNDKLVNLHDSLLVKKHLVQLLKSKRETLGQLFANYKTKLVDCWELLQFCGLLYTYHWCQEWVDKTRNAFDEDIARLKEEDKNRTSNFEHLDDIFDEISDIQEDLEEFLNARKNNTSNSDSEERQINDYLEKKIESGSKREDELWDELNKDEESAENLLDDAIKIANEYFGENGKNESDKTESKTTAAAYQTTAAQTNITTASTYSTEVISSTSTPVITESDVSTTGHGSELLFSFDETKKSTTTTTTATNNPISKPSSTINLDTRSSTEASTTVQSSPNEKLLSPIPGVKGPPRPTKNPITSTLWPVKGAPIPPVKGKQPHPVLPGSKGAAPPFPLKPVTKPKSPEVESTTVATTDVVDNIKSTEIPFYISPTNKVDIETPLITKIEVVTSTTFNSASNIDNLTTRTSTTIPPEILKATADTSETGDSVTSSLEGSSTDGISSEAIKTSVAAETVESESTTILELLSTSGQSATTTGVRHGLGSGLTTKGGQWSTVTTENTENSTLRSTSEVSAENTAISTEGITASILSIEESSTDTTAASSTSYSEDSKSSSLLTTTSNPSTKTIETTTITMKQPMTDSIANTATTPDQIIEIASETAGNENASTDTNSSPSSTLAGPTTTSMSSTLPDTQSTTVSIPSPTEGGSVRNSTQEIIENLIRNTSITEGEFITVTTALHETDTSPSWTSEDKTLTNSADLPTSTVSMSENPTEISSDITMNASSSLTTSEPLMSTSSKANLAETSTQVLKNINLTSNDPTEFGAADAGLTTSTPSESPASTNTASTKSTPANKTTFPTLETPRMTSIVDETTITTLATTDSERKIESTTEDNLEATSKADGLSTSKIENVTHNWTSPESTDNATITDAPSKANSLSTTVLHDSTASNANEEEAPTVYPTTISNQTTTSSPSSSTAVDISTLPVNRSSITQLTTITSRFNNLTTDMLTTESSTLSTTVVPTTGNTVNETTTNGHSSSTNKPIRSADKERITTKNTERPYPSRPIPTTPSPPSKGGSHKRPPTGSRLVKVPRDTKSDDCPTLEELFRILTKFQRCAKKCKKGEIDNVLSIIHAYETEHRRRSDHYESVAILDKIIKLFRIFLHRRPSRGNFGQLSQSPLQVSDLPKMTPVLSPTDDLRFSPPRPQITPPPYFNIPNAYADDIDYGQPHYVDQGNLIALENDLPESSFYEDEIESRRPRYRRRRSRGGRRRRFSRNNWMPRDDWY